MKAFYLSTTILIQTLLTSGQLTPILDSSTETFISQVLEHWQSPTGFGLAVVRRDATGNWVVETGGYGRASLDGSKNVTSDTLFSLASNSKAFTALAVGLMTHDKQISPPLTWSTRLKDILPGWGMIDEVANGQATVQDLLSHRTGLPRHDAAPRRTDTDADIIRKVAHLKPSALFRDIYQYSNTMYQILGLLPATLLPSRQPLARYVKANIFDPLGMSASTYSFAVANSSGQLASGIARDIQGTDVKLYEIPFFNPDSGEDGNNDAGPGGVISSAKDVAVFIQALLLNGNSPKTNESVVPEDVVRRISTGYSVMYGAARFPELSPVVYGGGQERGSYRGQEFVDHTGSVAGYNSVIARYPNSDYGIAVLSNDNELGSIITRIVQYYLADRMFGSDPVDWDSRYQAIYLSPGDGSGPTPRPANATFPYGDIKRLEGVYADAGYGQAEFCYITDSTSSVVPGGSKTCNDLRDDLMTSLVDSGTVKLGIPTFVAEWDNSFFSHIIMKHFDGGVFNLSAVQQYPTGNASSAFWYMDLGVQGRAEFNENLNGMAWTGVWDPAPGVPEPSGSTLKERAEVWFTRA